MSGRAVFSFALHCWCFPLIMEDETQSDEGEESGPSMIALSSQQRAPAKRVLIEEISSSSSTSKSGPAPPVVQAPTPTVPQGNGRGLVCVEYRDVYGITGLV